MSEFDKDAEREKLRAQIERDEERRQTTQQMSELLLKGATMLNAHCAECASPIFRYDNEEFCPTCGRTVDELRTAADEEQRSDDRDQPTEVETTPSTGTPAPTVTDGDQPSPALESEVDSRPEPTSPATQAGEALSNAIARLADRAATAEDARQAAEFADAAHRAAEALALLERSPE